MLRPYVRPFVNLSYASCWLRGTVVERRTLAGELFLSHVRLAAGLLTTAVGKPFATGQPTRATQLFIFWGR